MDPGLLGESETLNSTFETFKRFPDISILMIVKTGAASFSIIDEGAAGGYEGIDIIIIVQMLRLDIGYDGII